MTFPGHIYIEVIFLKLGYFIYPDFPRLCFLVVLSYLKKKKSHPESPLEGF